MKLDTIGQIAITVEDVPRSLGFYRDVLGLEFLFQPSADLAFLDVGGVRLMLTVPQGAGTPGENSVLYFRVDDIDEAHDELGTRGAEFERGPERAARLPDHELWLAFLRDPEGNLIGLMEERR
ncbi:MAG: VOC family protein [Wenzhouxiangellaceae bacterium]|nr:VOC family protein [Wenzhouxiangellaceae bacterium]